MAVAASVVQLPVPQLMKRACVARARPSAVRSLGRDEVVGLAHCRRIILHRVVRARHDRHCGGANEPSPRRTLTVPSLFAVTMSGWPSAFRSAAGDPPGSRRWRNCLRSGSPPRRRPRAPGRRTTCASRGRIRSVLPSRRGPIATAIGVGLAGEGKDPERSGGRRRHRSRTAPVLAVRHDGHVVLVVAREIGDRETPGVRIGGAPRPRREATAAVARQQQDAVVSDSATARSSLASPLKSPAATANGDSTDVVVGPRRESPCSSRS